MEEKTKQESKKKKIIIFGLVLLLGMLVGLGVVFREEIGARLKPAKSKHLGESSSGRKDKKQEFNFDWALWEDAAGFSFEYPREIEINIHADDDENYSWLTLSKEGKNGNVVILCNDTEYSNIDYWLENDELVRQGSGLETEVASISARKVALKAGLEIVGLIDGDGVIYTIEKQNKDNDDYWNEIYGHVLDSFKLIPLEGESETEFTQWIEGFNTSGVDVVEPVEIIE